MITAKESGCFSEKACTVQWKCDKIYFNKRCVLPKILDKIYFIPIGAPLHIKSRGACHLNRGPCKFLKGETIEPQDREIGKTMERNNVSFTPVDYAIIESYKGMLDGLGEYLGNGFELVLHSLENLDCSVVKILNGYHTGRSEGAPITALALEMLSQIKAADDVPYISYFTKNSQGDPLKSTTIAIRGEGNYFVALLCINFYLNTSLTEVIDSLMPKDAKHGLNLHEGFTDSVEDIIKNAVEVARERIYGDGSISASMKNRKIVEELYEKGIFSLKDSVIRCAELLGISKNTVYLHLRRIGKE